MRFNVGDILRVQGGNDLWRWLIRGIENEQYLLSYHPGNNIWVELVLPWSEDACRTLELDVPAQPPAPPAQEEITIYTALFKHNANGRVSAYSSTDRGTAENFKRSAENLGYIVLAMKKFKTRI